MITASRRGPRRLGSTMCTVFCHHVAPSTATASCTSRPMDCRPARHSRYTNGHAAQVSTSTRVQKVRSPISQLPPAIPTEPSTVFTAPSGPSAMRHTVPTTNVGST
jgi:hypothetical protein